VGRFVGVFGIVLGGHQRPETVAKLRAGINGK
jgi:hypothetical protein